MADAWAEISQDLEDDAVMGLVDRAVAACMSAAQMTSAAAGELADFLMDAGARQPQDLSGARRQKWPFFLKALQPRRLRRQLSYLAVQAGMIIGLIWSILLALESPPLYPLKWDVGRGPEIFQRGLSH